jgi:hypothetical protein
MLWDVFISHASEDKDEIARPLAMLLQAKGLRVWLDEQQLRLGDSLSRKINDGLAFSRFGIVVVSESFLGKDYPQKELQALLARQSADERYILPILHRVDHSVLKHRIPLLGDLLAISTDRGLDYVVTKVFKAISEGPSSKHQTGEARYFSEFQFPASLLSRAVGAVRLLLIPATWRHLVPKRDMQDPNTWMGSDSEVLVSLLFDLYAPLAHFWKHRYALQRTLTSLKTPDRMRYGFLNAALEALFNDLAISAGPPRLNYEPRFEGWRELRVATPAKYWWQGITQERFALAAPLFFESRDSGAVPSVSAFTKAYGVAYNAVGGAQQTLGLLANPLYGFTPSTRPVYWRLVLLWKSLYSVVRTLPEDMSRDDFAKTFLEEQWLEIEPFPSELAPEDLPESRTSTTEAVKTYFADYARPRLREFLG